MKALVFLIGLAVFGEEPLRLPEVQKEFNLLMNDGKVAEAEALARRLVAQEDAANRPESPACLRALDLILETYPFTADLLNPEIDRIGQRVLAARERVNGPEATATAMTLRFLAISHVIRGRFSEARALMERSLAIYEKTERDNHELTRAELSQYAKALADAAGILSEMRDFNSSKRVLLKSIELRQRLNPGPAIIGVSWLNLARVEHQLGNHADALNVLVRARAGLVPNLDKNDILIGELLEVEGRCQIDTGLIEQGRASFAESLKILETTLGPDHPKLTPTLDAQAELERLQGRPEAARTILERSLAIEHKAYGPMHPEVTDSESHLAHVLLQSGDTKGALEHALAAERNAREHLVLSVATLPEREATLFSVKRISALPLVVSLAADAKGATVEPAMDVLVRSRAIVFDELASRHGIYAADSEDAASILKLSDALRVARERLARLVISPPEEPAQRDQRLQQLIDERDAIDRKLASSSVQYRRRVASKSAGWAEVKAALPADAVLVSFVRTEHELVGSAKASDEYAVFVAARNAPVAAYFLGSSAVIQTAVDEMRAKLALEAAAPGVATKRNELAYRAAAEKVRRLIWDPIERYVSGVKTIFIVPDGVLNAVNFAALPEPGSDKGYMVERNVVFHYLSTERDLVAAATLDNSGSGLLAVGNATFDRTGASDAPTATVFRGARSTCSGMQSMRFNPLPSSGKEIDDIAGLWKRNGRDKGDVVELSGDLAGPDRFKAMAPGRRALHLAVHGFAATSECADPIRDENPLLLAGLALAGANRHAAADDGIITAEEIAALDLRGVEWAVLSACDTGLGLTASSEGVFGLRRAFQVAGAHTVIMSLWPVEDQVTSAWMRTLYDQRLRQHLDTASSVKAADLEILKRRRAAGLGTHPFYWAPFVAVGDWR